MTTPSLELRTRWLEALLPLVPFEGWTRAVADKAAQEAGLTQGEQALAAPRGLADLVDGFFDTAETEANTALLATDFTGMGVRAKVASGVKLWLAALSANREAARCAATRGFLPWVAGDALQRTWSTADMIWTGIGDTSTDYNKYSKRALLAATLPLIFMRWLDEEDEEVLDTYISDRLTRAMKFGQAGDRLAGPFLDALEKLRMPAQPDKEYP